MKVVLDLKKSFNNYHWEDKEELEAYILYMKQVLWEFYKEESENGADMEDNILFRLYDILDMFEKFEVKESDSNV